MITEFSADIMFPWRFLEDDTDLLADLVLFYPRSSPLTAQPPQPPPPPPGRFHCSPPVSSEQCEAVLDLSSGLTTVLLTATGQGRTPNLPLVTVGSALLFSIVCVTIFFTCRHHKRKMDFLAYKPGPQLSHVVLGPSARKLHDRTLLDSYDQQQNESVLPDMYGDGGYGATLPSQKVPLTPALVLLEGPRKAGSKEHFNPIYEELDQHGAEYDTSAVGYHSSRLVEPRHLEQTNGVKPAVAGRSCYQLVTSRRPGSENIYASIEDQRFC